MIPSHETEGSSIPCDAEPTPPHRSGRLWGRCGPTGRLSCSARPGPPALRWVSFEKVLEMEHREREQEVINLFCQFDARMRHQSPAMARGRIKVARPHQRQNQSRPQKPNSPSPGRGAGARRSDLSEIVAWSFFFLLTPQQRTRCVALKNGSPLECSHLGEQRTTRCRRGTRRWRPWRKVTSRIRRRSSSVRPSLALFA